MLINRRAQSRLSRTHVYAAAAALMFTAPLLPASIAHAGGLMTYGPNLQAAFRRLASFVVRVLNGAQPSDLPIEQPTTLELVLNRRTAATIGVRFPDTLVAQAEEIIE